MAVKALEEEVRKLLEAIGERMGGLDHAFSWTVILTPLRGENKGDLYTVTNLTDLQAAQLCTMQATECIDKYRQENEYGRSSAIAPSETRN